jgi:hypothetical protein
MYTGLLSHLSSVINFSFFYSSFLFLTLALHASKQVTLRQRQTNTNHTTNVILQASKHVGTQQGQTNPDHTTEFLTKIIHYAWLLHAQIL